MVAIAVVAGLIGSVQNIDTQRTQAPQVAAVINAQAKPGDIIAFCPDQLGPAVYRVIDDPGQYKMVTFPRGTGPQFVDWVNYAKVVHAAKRDRLRRQAGGRGRHRPPHLAGLAAGLPDLRRQVRAAGGDAAVPAATAAGTPG